MQNERIVEYGAVITNWLIIRHINIVDERISEWRQPLGWIATTPKWEYVQAIVKYEWCEDKPKDTTVNDTTVNDDAEIDQSLCGEIPSDEMPKQIKQAIFQWMNHVLRYDLGGLKDGCRVSVSKLENGFWIKVLLIRKYNGITEIFGEKNFFYDTIDNYTND